MICVAVLEPANKEVEIRSAPTSAMCSSRTRGGQAVEPARYGITNLDVYGDDIGDHLTITEHRANSPTNDDFSSHLSDTILLVLRSLFGFQAA